MRSERIRATRLAERLARNERPPAARQMTITLFAIPERFARLSRVGDGVTLRFRVKGFLFARGQAALFAWNLLASFPGLFSFFPLYGFNDELFSILIAQFVGNRVLRNCFSKHFVASLVAVCNCHVVCIKGPFFYTTLS